MTLLTLPGWVREGQTVETSLLKQVLGLGTDTAGIWTIGGVRTMNTIRDSMVRVERTTEDSRYVSMYVALDVFLRDWRKAAAA